MNIYKEKQKEFFYLADSYYSDSIDDYYTLRRDYRIKDDGDVYLYKMIIATKMGLACEYYLKGILLPLLRIRIPEDVKTEELENIISSLTEEEKYNIINENIKEIINNISSKTGIKKSKLQFLKENTLRTNQHNIVDIINQIDENVELLYKENEKDYYDNKITDEEYDALYKMIDMSSSLKSRLVSFLRYRTHVYRRDNKLLNLHNFDNELEEIRKLKIKKNNENINLDEEINNLFKIVESILNEANIYSPFSEARYGTLEKDYDLDLRMLHECMDEIKNNTYFDNCLLLELKSNKNIKRIYPDLNSSIYILKGKEVERVYNTRKFDGFVDELINNNKLNSKQIINIKKYNEQDNFYYDYLGCIQEYGIEDYDLEKSPYKFIFGLGETSIFNNLIIGPDEIICYFENGQFKACYNHLDKRIFKGTYEASKEGLDIIKQYENNKNNDKKYLIDKEYLNYIFCNYDFSFGKPEKKAKKYL